MNPDNEPTSNEWNPESYDENHLFVSEYGDEVVGLLEHEPGDRVLDLGCGTGHLTAHLAERDGSVVGVDRSAAMIARARRTYPDLEFVRADARALDDAVDGPFDAIFSNAALHWIRDQDAVLAAASEVLRPGGQFVAELGGSGNVDMIIEATEAELEARGYDGTNPWFFPSIAEYTARFEDHGFEPRHAVLFDRPTRLDSESGLRDWLEMFGDSLLAGVPEGELDTVLAAIESRLEDKLYGNRTWYADYRRLRIRAIRLPE